MSQDPFVRINMKLNSLTDRGEKLKEALDLVGVLLTSEGRRIAKYKDIIQTERLINSIAHEVSATSDDYELEVGPRGVKYAKFQEFGARRTEASRARMFAELREMGVIGQRPARSGFTRTQHAARPFMNEALGLNRKKIAEIIINVFRGK